MNTALSNFAFSVPLVSRDEALRAWHLQQERRACAAMNVSFATLDNGVMVWWDGEHVVVGEWVADTGRIGKIAWFDHSGPGWIERALEEWKKSKQQLEALLNGASMRLNQSSETAI